MTTPDVQVGQIWRSNDDRDSNRVFFEVVELGWKDCSKGGTPCSRRVAIVKPVGRSVARCGTKSITYLRMGETAKSRQILVERMKPTARGYKLLRQRLHGVDIGY